VRVKERRRETQRETETERETIVLSIWLQEMWYYVF